MTASFGIFGGIDALKAGLKINSDAAKFSASVAKSASKGTLASAVDSADFKNVIPTSVPAARRSVADVEAGVKDVAAFLDSPEGKVLQELESVA